MSWQFVYNGHVLAGTHIDDLVKLVVKTGYKFFHHNGKVYFLSKDGYYDTGITTEDLK